MHIAIVCACLPVGRAFLRKHFPRVVDYTFNTFVHGIQNDWVIPARYRVLRLLVGFISVKGDSKHNANRRLRWNSPSGAYIIVRVMTIEHPPCKPALTTYVYHTDNVAFRDLPLIECPGQQQLASSRLSPEDGLPLPPPTSSSFCEYATPIITPGDCASSCQKEMSGSYFDSCEAEHRWRDGQSE